MSIRSGSGTPRALIVGSSGTVLSQAEKACFRDCDPAGYILFRRNIETPEQVRALVAEFRECVGRDDAPVLIDQEGGRVARLPSPPWRKAPPAAVFGALFETDPDLAVRGAYLNSVLIGAELRDLGINVDCAPLLDLRLPGAHDIIGDRSFGADPDLVARLGRAACDGFLASGVIPVIKHVPGHGRARVDSHHSLPVVETPLDTLRQSDFAPFRELADMPMAMTAHIVYTAVDPARCATASPTVIGGTVRGEIGFDGFLMSDDLCMKALSGPLAARADAVLEAGCDAVLHCNGALEEMRLLGGRCPALSESGARRLAAALARVRGAEHADAAGSQSELNEILEKIDS